MINQMDEDRRSYNLKRLVKVRAFERFGINEIYSKLDSLSKKKPSRIIIHLGTNDAVTRTSQSILDDLFKLKQYIEAKGIEVIISCPITRTDNAKARFSIIQFKEKIKHLKIRYLLNDNIKERHLGKKGLHLSKQGILATNFTKLLRKL